MTDKNIIELLKEQNRQLLEQLEAIKHTPTQIYVRNDSGNVCIGGTQTIGGEKYLEIIREQQEAIKRLTEGV